MLESSLYMRNQLLRDTDWASMAHSLEVRVPLVDVELLSHVALVTTKNRSPSKRMLGNSPRVPLPSKVIERPKTGFGTPIQAWLQRDSAHPAMAASSHTPWGQVCLGEALGL